MSKTKHQKSSKKDKRPRLRQSKVRIKPSKFVTFRYSSPKQDEANRPPQSKHYTKLSKIVTFRYAASKLACEEDLTEDLVEDSFVISLNDPISNKRIITPVRSRFCSHVECFDLDSFFVMNNLNKVKLKPSRPGSLTRLMKKISSPGVRNSPASERMKVVISEFQPVFQQINRCFHNQITTSFDYKLRLTENRKLGLRNNDLKFFRCPICGLEFNIYDDLLVADCLSDLLSELDKMKKIRKDRIYYKGSEVLQNYDLVDRVKVMPDASWTFLSRSDTMGKESTSKPSEVITLDDTFSDEEIPSDSPKEVQFLDLEKETWDVWTEGITVDCEQEEDNFFRELTKGTKDNPMVLD